MKDREYIGNSGGRRDGGTGILEECYMLGAGTSVTIKTLIEEKVAIGAAWVGTKNYDAFVKFGWKVNELLVSIGELLSRD